MLIVRRIRPLPPTAVLALSGAISLAAPVAYAVDDSATDIEELLVTATFLPRSIDQIAGTVSVVERADIERQLIEDLNEITRLQPGISMDSAARGGNQGFSIRGIGGNRVLMLIDGVRSSDIYGAGPSSYGKDAFETDDLRAIEIIRGPASALYGADAMGGAVILRTRDPEDYLRAGQSSALNLKSSYASANGLLKSGLSYAFQVSDFGSIMQYTQRSYHEMDGSPLLNPQEADSRALMSKSVWRPTPSQTLHLTIDHFYEHVATDIDSELGPSIQESIGKDSSERLRLSISHTWDAQGFLADQIDTQLHWQRSDGRQRSEQLRTSYSFVEHGKPHTYGGTLVRRYSDFEFDQKTLSLKLMMRKTLATGPLHHDMAYGLSGERTQTERPRARCDIAQSTAAISCAIASYPFAAPEVFPNKTFPDTQTRRSGVYWQDEVSLLDARLRLIPGIRHDLYEMQPRVDALLNGGGDISNFGGYQVSAIETSHTTYNLGLLYDLNDSATVFAQYAEGFRPPNFDESNQAFVNLGHGYATVPNPKLEAESSTGIEAGIRGAIASVDLSITAYQNNYKNFIESKAIGQANGISLFQDRNIGEVEIYGAELNAAWRLSQSWSMHSALAWSRGEDLVSKQALDSVAPLTAIIGTRFDDALGNWGIESLITLVAQHDRVSAADRVTGDAYALLDLVAYINLSPSANMRFGLFNALNEQYAAWNSIKGLAISDTESIAKAQAPGSNFRLSLNFEI